MIDQAPVVHRQNYLQVVDDEYLRHAEAAALQQKQLTRSQRRKQQKIAKARRQAERAQKRADQQPTGLTLRSINPLTETQRRTFEAFARDKHLLLHGYAGTGKTFCALYLAFNEVLYNEKSPYQRVVIIRSVVASRDMGYLPGDVKEKARAYEEPYEEMCNELFNNPRAYQMLHGREQVEFTTTSFLRGTTFNNCIIVVDEINNMVFQEIDTIMTRVGRNCRIVFCGDFRQSDLVRARERDGIHTFMEILNNMKDEFEYVEFHQEDIVRSALVKAYIISKAKVMGDVANHDHGQQPKWQHHGNWQPNLPPFVTQYYYQRA